jgi:hypothetical protein
MNNGRLFFTTLLTVFVVSFFAAPSAFAASHASYTTVRGNIYSENTSVSGIPVTVVCVGRNGSIKQTTTTDRSGLYTVYFNANQCGKYQSVSATLTLDGQTQTQTVTVSSQNTATMNFSCGTISVPEFGLIPGAIATIISAGSFLAIKRRKN